MSIGIIITLWITFASAIINLALTVYLLRRVYALPEAKDAQKRIIDAIKAKHGQVISPLKLRQAQEIREQLIPK